MIHLNPYEDTIVRAVLQGSTLEEYTSKIGLTGKLISRIKDTEFFYFDIRGENRLHYKTWLGKISLVSDGGQFYIEFESSIIIGYYGSQADKQRRYFRLEEDECFVSMESVLDYMKHDGYPITTNFSDEVLKGIHGLMCRGLFDSSLFFPEYSYNSLTGLIFSGLCDDTKPQIRTLQTPIEDYAHGSVIITSSTSDCILKNSPSTTDNSIFYHPGFEIPAENKCLYIPKEVVKLEGKCETNGNETKDNQVISVYDKILNGSKDASDMHN